VNGYGLRFALAWLVGLGVGCSSAPVRYYTLTSPPDKTLPVSETTPVIDVRVVHTPSLLNRSELMVRTGPTEVALLENERWASPVNDELKDAIRLELQRRLSRTAGLGPAFSKLTLDIDVQHIEAQLGRYALLEVSWGATLSAAPQRSNGAWAATCTFRAEEQIHADYAGIVEGYQREIAALAEAIAAVLTSPANGSDAPCQKSIKGAAGASGSQDH
jgi:uncharacterized lipoprotein YmbA